MLTLLRTLLLALLAQPVFSQTVISGSFDHGGITRTYSFYVPASYVPGEPVPLVLNLHGLGTDGTYQMEKRDFRPIADTANFIVVHPDGSYEQLTNQRFWNYGNVAGSTVDDVGFLEALIDTISAHYSINPNRVYSAGMSNGSFMTYYLACQTDRFAAIGTVTGSMSTEMSANCSPSHPTPSIHIHGTSDGINPYTGTSTMTAVEDVSLFWANQNGCNTVPVAQVIPDIDPDDDATAERFIYTGGINGHTVERFKVTGGGHTWPGADVFTLLGGNTCMDFSASIEIWRFFSQYERMDPAGIEESSIPTIDLWPNPGNGLFYISMDDHPLQTVEVYDMLGQRVIHLSCEEATVLDLTFLESGTYLLHLRGSDFLQIRKVIIGAD